MHAWERMSDSNEETVVKGIMVLAAVIASVLVLSSTASANAITCAHSATNCSPGSPDGGIQSNSGGTLPFTGADLAGAAGLAGLLLVSGVTLHRLGRRRS